MSGTKGPEGSEDRFDIYVNAHGLNMTPEERKKARDYAPEPGEEGDGQLGYRYAIATEGGRNDVTEDDIRATNKLTVKASELNAPRIVSGLPVATMVHISELVGWRRG